MSKKSDQDNRANQLNPNNEAYQQSREKEQSDLDNHASQGNPSNDAYWQSRGDDERPSDWKSKREK
jgi:hypothetical protein